MDDRVDEDDDDAEEEVASDGCHEGSRWLPLGGGVGSVMTLVLWVDCMDCGGLRLREKKKPGGLGRAA